MKKIVNNKMMLVVCALFLAHSTFIISAQPENTQNEVAEQQQKKKTPWWKSTYAKIGTGIAAIVAVVALSFVDWKPHFKNINNPLKPTEVNKNKSKTLEQTILENTLIHDFHGGGVEIVLNNGIDTWQDAENGPGETPLMIAVRKYQENPQYWEPLIRRLVDNGASTTIENNDQMSALLYTVKFDSVNLFKQFLERIKNENTINQINFDVKKNSKNPRIKEIVKQYHETGTIDWSIPN